MARRGGKYKGGPRKTRFERPPDAKGGRKYLMLNLHNIDVFRYELREVLAGSEMAEPLRESFIATVMGKGTKMSVQEAKDYVGEVLVRGDIDEPTAETIVRIIDRHTRRR